MGTNYYLELDEKKRCECCGQLTEENEKLHIGKSSAGWCFSLHVIPERELNTLQDWYEFIQHQGWIVDEYGDKVLIADFLQTVTERESTPLDLEPYAKLGIAYLSEEEFYRKNHAEPGPNNLLRHKVDGVHCIGHGEGTWDYITGEFS